MTSNGNDAEAEFNAQYAQETEAQFRDMIAELIAQGRRFLERVMDLL